MPKDTKEATIEKNFSNTNSDVILSVKTSMHLDDHTRPNEPETEQDATTGAPGTPVSENFQTGSEYDVNIDNLLNPLIDSHTVLTMTVSADSKENVPATTSVFLNNKDITLPTNYASTTDSNELSLVKNNNNFLNSDTNVIVEELKNWNLLGGETYELSLKNVNSQVSTSTPVKDTHLIIFDENFFI